MKRARGGINGIGNDGDAPGPSLPGIGVERDLRFFADFRAGEISFVDIAQGPDGRDVRDSAERQRGVERLRVFAKGRADIENHARTRRDDAQFRGGVVGIHSKNANLLRGSFQFSLRHLGVALRLLIVLLGDGVVGKKVFRARESFLLDFIIHARFVVIRDGAGKIVAF